MAKEEIKGIFKKEYYEYELPEELIAQYPPPRRGTSRMMVVKRKGGEILHRKFNDISDFLRKNDVLVVNNSRVLNARIIFRKVETGGRLTVLFVKKEGRNYRFYVERGKRIKQGTVLQLEGTEIYGKIVSVEERFFNLEPQQNWDEKQLFKKGSIPLPPYIKRKPRDEDSERYQTIFAENEGSIASPTAGLHFSHSTVEQLKSKGIKFVPVTLHVSISTFQPLRVKDIRNHKLYPEYVIVSEKSAGEINSAREKGGKVVCVGTTSVRAVESALKGERVFHFEGPTNLYIYPGYEFKVVDAMLTNFHLPSSSLLLMVCAFGGYNLIMKAYKKAVEERYRFYSYGDCMLIL